MKQVWAATGRLLFWLSWPLLYVYLRIGRRTRAIIEHDGKILVVKGWLGSGEWLLPGGGLHVGEEPINGLIREVKEETGIELDSRAVKYLGTGQTKNKGHKFSYEAFYIALQHSGALNPKPLEIVEIAWQSPGDLNTTNSSQDLLDIISQYYP